MVSNKQIRWRYALCAILLLAIEIAIALWVHDRWIRPYGGDMLVTVLLCCGMRILFPDRPKWLPVYIFLFAALVEFAQWLDILSLTGLGRSPFFSILIGNTFSVADLICYAVGCLIFFLAERWLRPTLHHKQRDANHT